MIDTDRRAIEALNEHDIRAALRNDVEAIISQWTDDFVVIPPAGPAIRGRETNAALARQVTAQMAIEPIEYAVTFDEIVIAGDHAFEWGTYRGVARPPAGGDLRYSGKIMRILQRQADGGWKMHRTMTTLD